MWVERDQWEAGKDEGDWKGNQERLVGAVELGQGWV